jgi:WD40 repeat protein
VSFDGAGKLLATACLDDQARLFAMHGETAEPQWVVAGLSSQPPVFLEGDAALLTRTGPREFTRWDIATGKPGWRLSCEEEDAEHAHAVASPDQSRLAIYGGFDVWLYDAARHEAPLARLTHLNWTRDAAFSPDSQRLITVSIDRQALAWSAGSGAAVFGPMNHQDELSQAAFAPHGRLFATAQQDGLVRVWHEPVRADWAVDIGQLDFRAVPSADGRHVAVAGWSLARQVQEASVYDLATGARVGGPLRPRGGLNGAAFSADASQLATLSSMEENAAQQYWSDVRWAEQPGWVQFWNWRTATEEGAVATPSEPVGAAYDPDGRRLVAVCAAGQILVIDPATQSTVKQLAHPGKAIAGLTPVRWTAFSPQGDVFATWGLGSSVHLWDAKSYEERHVLPHDSLVLDAAFSPDGRHIATGSRDKTARVWTVATGQLASPALAHADWVFHVAFRPDGLRLLTACRDHTAQVWEWRRGERATAALKHGDEVFSALFSPDGRWIVTSSRDSTARVWSAASGKPLSPPYAVDYGSRELLISPDGSRAILCGGKLYGLDLSSLAETDSLDAAAPRLRLGSEVVSGQRIHDASLANLTSQEWLQRWRQLRHEAALRPTDP